MKKFIAIILGLFLATPLIAQKDTLILRTGEEIIGDVKFMENSIIVIDTEDSDVDLQVEWNKVKAFNSERVFRIILSDGEKLNGTIDEDPANEAEVIITEEDKTINAAFGDIMMLKPFEDTFLGRFSASIDFGFNMTKANSLKQSSLRSKVGYITNKWATDASFDMVSSSQDNADDTKRKDGALQVRRIFKKGWFLSLSANFLQNDAQMLKLRTTLKAAAGKYIVDNDNLNWSFLAGLAWNNEKYTDPDLEKRSNAEGYVGTELNVLNIKDLSLYTSVALYPGISESDRFRTDFKFDIKYDLPLNFYVKLGYTHNFDNKPVEGASKNDYVLQTSIGWEL